MSLKFISPSNLTSILSDFKTKVLAAAGLSADSKDTATLNAAKAYADSTISTKLSRTIVASLPDVGTADASIIYLILKTVGETGNLYDEYILINGAFEKIGADIPDLANYSTTSAMNTAISSAVSAAADIEMTADDITAFNTALWV